MDPIDYDNEEIIEDDFSDEEVVDKTETSKTKKKGAITIQTVDDDDASDVQSDNESVAQNDPMMNESDDEFDDDEEIDDEEIENKIFSKQKDENEEEEDAELNPFREDDFSDDEEEKEEDYLQKIDDDYKENLISSYHPELHNINYDEVEALSKVVRDSDGNIIDPLHRTQPFVTKYEKARVIGERAKQINAGSKSFVSVDESVIDGYLVALKEFEEKKLPFIIKRPLPNGGCEYWKLHDLEILI
jgi:DNA-directed RNA polymerases I, II, and III subunit RPABC2|uniref:DNA-directed RNA polymerase n=1 Tax=viral metagenome TaxID=1070528 RepID=A0A6C0IJB1_9ZZZZ